MTINYQDRINSKSKDHATASCARPRTLYISSICGYKHSFVIRMYQLFWLKEKAIVQAAEVSLSTNTNAQPMYERRLNKSCYHVLEHRYVAAKIESETRKDWTM